MNTLDHCTVRKIRGTVNQYEWFTTLFLGQHGDHAGTVMAADRNDALAQVKAHVERILARKRSYEEVHAVR
jgi:hypothetical protein